MARQGRAFPATATLSGRQKLAVGGTSYDMMIALTASGGLTVPPPLFTLQLSSSLGATGGIMPGAAQAAVLDQALVQAAAVALTHAVTAEQVLALGVSVGLNATLLRTMAMSLGLACNVSAVDTASLTQMLATLLTVQGSMTATASRVASLVTALSGTAGFTSTATRTASLALALSGDTSLETEATFTAGLLLALSSGVSLSTQALLTTQLAALLGVTTTLDEAHGLSFPLTTSLTVATGIAPLQTLAKVVFLTLFANTELTASQVSQVLSAISLSTQVEAADLTALITTLQAALDVRATAPVEQVTTRTLATSLLASAQLSPADSLMHTITASLAVQSALALTTGRDIESVVALAQSSLVSVNTHETAVLLSSLTLAANLAPLASLLTQMNSAMSGTTALSAVQQFTAIGQVTLASQAMLTQAGVGLFGVAVVLASESGTATAFSKIYDAAVSLSTSGSVAVLTDLFRSYLLSVELGTSASLSTTEQHAIALRVVETITAALQTQQIAQFAALVELGVHPQQAVAATATIQMLTAIGAQTLLTVAAERLGLVAPDVIRIANERLLQALGVGGALRKPHTTDEKIV